VQEKLGNDKKMIAELEAAAKIEPNKETSLLLMKAYGLKGMEDKAQALKRSIKKRSIKAKPRKVIRPPRVVV